MVGPTSITCVNCERRPPCSAIRSGQWTTIGSRVPPRCEATCFPHWNGQFAGPRPRGGVVRAHHVAAPGLEAAPLQHELELLLVGQRNPVEHRQLVEGAGQGAFHAGAVVAPDVDHERVLELAHLVDRVDHATDVPVRVLAVARVHLHLARVEALAGLVERVPGRHRVGARRQLRVGRDHPALLLALEGLLAELVPALVELALVLVRPLAPAPDAARGCSRSRSTRTTASPSRGRARRGSTRSSCRPSRPGSSSPRPPARRRPCCSR